MILFLDTSEDLEVCAAESNCAVGQLLTPLTSYRWRGGVWAGDNGAFANFDPKNYRSWLTRQLPHREHCKFITVPDVVGSARRTLELFHHWYPKLHGWPLALVAQDGLEDLEIPWKLISAIFIGGSTQWKLSSHAAACIKTAKAMEKWTHVGRVNTPERFDKFLAMGADSIDGTGISRFSHMRNALGKGNPLFEFPAMPSTDIASSGVSTERGNDNV